MYKRSNVYPNGQPIPASLPESYQPAAYGNAPEGQSCFSCKNFDLTTRYCSAWKAPVKPRWWCEGWATATKATSNKPDGTLLKKITTNTVEEHFADVPKFKATPSAVEYENEEDVIRLNVPLVIRLLEYAREDANHDVDLHIIVENMIDLSEDGDILEMEHYPDIVKIETED